MKKETCFTDASCPLSEGRILNKVITSAPEVVKYIQENYDKIKMHEDLMERLSKLVKYVDDNFNVRGDGIIQELKSFLKQAENTKPTGQ